jgi:hypothetical protein
MDNKILRVNGEGVNRLEQVFNLLDHANAVGYNSSLTKLVFFWYDESKSTPFPSSINHRQMAEIAQSWLEKTAEYPDYPDIDGDCERGWIAYCDGWGHIAGFGHGSFVAIEPQWMMYGK